MPVLGLFNKNSNLRWMLWQIPMGNSNSPNIDNPSTNVASAPSAAAGWKDNRPEYFFCSESNQHLGQFADAGVIALLFGAGGTGCTDQTSDYYPDGQLFLKSRAGAVVKCRWVSAHGRSAFSACPELAVTKIGTSRPISS